MKIIGTVVVTSCISKRSEYVSEKVRSYLRAGICKKRWNALALHINPLHASVALIKKLVNWFAQEINWLVSVSGQHWHSMGQGL